MMIDQAATTNRGALAGSAVDIARKVPLLTRKQRSWLLRGLSIVFVLLLWEWAGRLPVGPTFPSFTATMVAMAEMARDGSLFVAYVETLKAMVIGVGLCVAIGAGMGIVMGLSRRFEWVTLPVWVILQAAPMAAIIPVITYLYGVGVAAKVLAVADVRRTYAPPRGLMRLVSRAASEEIVVALDGVTLEAAAGRVFGLVGPNGAGKSTLIRIISGLIDPDSGSVRVAGADTVTDRIEASRALGLVLADDRSLYWRLTGRQNLAFHGALYGMSREHAAARADELLERVGLAHRDRRVFGYSTGMRASLGIARALMHDPSRVREVEIDDGAANLDLNTPDDLAQRER